MAQWPGELWAAVECGGRGGLPSGPGRRPGRLLPQRRLAAGFSGIQRRIRGPVRSPSCSCHHPGCWTDSSAQLRKIRGTCVHVHVYTYMYMYMLYIQIHVHMYNVWIPCHCRKPYTVTTPHWATDLCAGQNPYLLYILYQGSV